jgi:cysteine desulfurase/selenocysteine lyase
MSNPTTLSNVYDVGHIRAQFPILSREVYKKPLVYLDNAATTHKPNAVLDAEMRFYKDINSNVHRGVHRLSQDATVAMEKAREKMQAFLGAAYPEEIIWVRGATEAINLVAATFGRSHVKAGDRVLISHMEHHSNIVPWQLLCEQVGAHLDVIPMNSAGELLLDRFHDLLTPRTRILALSHVSNALGTVNPVKAMTEAAHKAGAVVLLDGAQAVPHQVVNVRDLNCDFYALSGHKMYGPTGIGVLYGRRALLEKMPPYQGGGDMIASVTFEKTTYNTLPHKFEAGTPNIAGAIGLGAAADWMTDIGISAIAQHEAELLHYATEQLLSIPGLTVRGTAREKASVVSFTLSDAHPHDIGTIVDRAGVAIRAGHHCAQPVMDFFGVPATARASFAAYNTREEVDILVQSLRRVQEMFAS